MCIGGWAAMHLEPENRMSVYIQDATKMMLPDASYEAIADLCNPKTSKLSYCLPEDQNPYSASPAQAAQAIRNVIEFDDPKWHEVMGYTIE
jgi:hypothetical protein